MHVNNIKIQIFRIAFKSQIWKFRVKMQIQNLLCGISSNHSAPLYNLNDIIQTFGNVLFEKMLFIFDQNNGFLIKICSKFDHFQTKIGLYF